MTSPELAAEIAAIKQRNARVEADKAWETSHVRLLSVALLTYASMVLLMWVIGTDKPYIAAIIPTAGFVLSNMSLRAIKQRWIARHFKS